MAVPYANPAAGAREMAEAAMAFAGKPRILKHMAGQPPGISAGAAAAPPPACSDLMSELRAIEEKLRRAAGRRRLDRALRGMWRGFFLAVCLWLALATAYKLLPLPP
ncbi:MAG TPA: hypothetical protein PKE47_02415, partial [Verrucomicrobiota bacterium]|nr:hypothetical protein [Verrucomicrobiota bacterium]